MDTLELMKRLYLLRFVAILSAVLLVMTPWGCAPEADPQIPEKEEVGSGSKPGGDDESGSGEDPGGEDEPGNGDNSGGSGSGEGGENGSGKDPEPNPEPDLDPEPEMIDPGEKPEEKNPSPQYPDMEHSVEYSDFYNPVQDYLDECGNIDYVLSQGNGTAWPMVTDEGWLRLYQGSNASKGGSYMRVRSKNGAKLLSVTIGTATPSKVAHSLNGKAAKSATTVLEAGEKYTVDGLDSCTEVCFYCMGTSQSERLTVNYIKVEYKGGFVESDFYEEPKEYGPLMKAGFPYTQSFDGGEFPTTDKPTYYKYGLTAGKENLQWSTWFGSFSWQNPIGGSQSVQLRVYQEDEDYDQSQFGYVKMEFFLKDLREVSFKYYMSEFWMRATISFCEFGKNEWRNPEQIALEKYADRQTVRDFRYVLDEGRPHDAKIRIEIDPSTGFPTRDHYDFIVDDFIFR